MQLIGLLLDISNSFQMTWQHVYYKDSYTVITLPLGFSFVFDSVYQLASRGQYGDGNNWTEIIDGIGSNSLAVSTRNGNNVIETLEGFVITLGY